ncbi:MAG: neuraminidase-like domain-containing protein [Methylococcales bacterium]
MTTKKTSGQKRDGQQNAREPEVQTGNQRAQRNQKTKATKAVTQVAVRPDAGGVQDEASLQVSVWEVLTSRISPLLGGHNLTVMGDNELSALAKSADIALDALRELAGAEKLSSESGLEAALHFALIKQHQGSDLNTLLAHRDAELLKALQTAVARHVIPADFTVKFGDAIRTFDALRFRYGSLQPAMESIGIKLPPNLVKALIAQGIKTLDDLRRAGGIDNLKKLPIKAEDPVLKALGAACQFAVFTDKPLEAKALLQAGFYGLAEVGRTSPKTFQQRIRKYLDSESALALHSVAKTQFHLINNYVTGVRVQALTNPTAVPQNLAKHLPQTCHCCRDAASPAAYLADLLDYTVRHVKHGGSAVTLSSLEASLHQPFSGLPITCEDENVRQVRICIEVLRDMLPDPQKTDTPQFYLENVYRRMLELSSTSFDEIRAARAMGTNERKALADRLQIHIDPNGTRPDILDELFVDPDATALSEAWLEAWFGLRASTTPPLAPPVGMSHLLHERLHYSLEQWRAADFKDITCPLGAYPLIDPDIVGMADLADSTNRSGTNAPKTIWTAADFLDERQRLLDGAIAFLNTSRTQAYPHLTFSRMMLDLVPPFVILNVGASITANLIDVSQTNPQLVLKPLLYNRLEMQSGKDISAWLAMVDLSLDEFDILSRMADLQVNGLDITESEWKDFNAIIVNRAKKVCLTQWRAEERAAQNQIALTSQHFRLRPDAGDVYAWKPVQFRSDLGLRRKWESTLRSRLYQEQALPDAAVSAVDAVEREYLVSLRDDRMAAAQSLGLLGGGAGALKPKQRKWFVENLLIDCEMPACAMTTRIEQAIETVHGLLFGIRNGLLDDIAYDIDDPGFDSAWQWLGSYETWRAAMTVFLYPENVLRPALRKLSSPGFEQLVNTLREDARISTSGAQAALLQYQLYFIDVCNLEPIGVRASGFPIRTIFAIAQSKISGALMFSSWDELPGWGTAGSPDQTPWAYISWADDLKDKQSQGRKKVISIVPFRDGLAQYGIYLIAQIQLTGQNLWVCAQWQAGKATKFVQCLAPHPLLLTEQRATIDSDSNTTGVGTIISWSFSSADQMAVLGGSSLLLLYSGLVANGKRRVALARSEKASLVLIASELIDEQWTVPDFSNPVIMGQRILVANYTTSQIGWIDYTNNRLQPQPVLIQSAINGSAGTWNVSLENGSTRTAFRAVNLDGGGERVLAFEYQIPPSSAFESPLRTFVNVFSSGTSGLIFEHQQDLDLPSLAQPKAPGGWSYWPNPDVLGVIWQQFIVLRSGFGPSGRADPRREDVLVHAPLSTEKYDGKATSGQVFYGRTHKVTLQALLRWDTQASKFVFADTHWTIVQGDEAQPITSTQNSWKIHEADQFFPVRDFFSRPLRDRLIALNSTTKNIALIDYDNFGYLATTFFAAGDISSASGLLWNLAADDTVTVARIMQSASESALLTNPLSGDLCVLQITESALTPVFVGENYSVSSPVEGGAKLDVKWAEQFYVTDIDNDGLDEIIVMSGNPSFALGYSIWHGLAELTSSSISRPTGVIEFDLSSPDLAADSLEARAVRIRNSYAGNQLPGMEQTLLYLDEAYYYVHLEIAVRLTSAGHYEQALELIRTVFNYEMTGAARFVAYKLVTDLGTPSFNRTLDWLSDPLNPHAIASTRPLSYLKYTILTTVRCLLAYADSEFTYGTAESVNRARELYLKAIELLDSPEIRVSSNPCEDLIGILETTIGVGEWIWPDIKEAALGIVDRAELVQLVDSVRSIMASSEIKSIKLDQALKLLREAPSGEARNLGSTISANSFMASITTSAALAEIPRQFEAKIYRKRTPGHFIPAPTATWCVPLNAEFDTLRRHADINLRKIRNCRNIAGLEVIFEPEAAPTAAQLDLSSIETLGQLRKLVERPLPPLPYRYPTLIERAKQLVDVARQIEQSMLGTLQLADQKRYEILKARQDLSLMQAGVRLRDIQVIQAGDATRTARLQRDKAQIQVDEYEARLHRGMSTNESMAVFSQYTSSALATIIGVATGGVGLSGAMGQFAGAIGGIFANISETADMEARKQEWRYQVRLGQQDLQIGNQQIRVSQDQELAASQERIIAAVQANNVAVTLDFLATGQFENLALYEWMSGVLETIYRFFLQQATSIAKMAESQLAFERQQRPPTVIRADYWIPPDTGMLSDFSAANGAPDVKGLTGSARLLRDIYELDQYAFTTNQRKLQLIETISLAQLDPIAFQRFRQTGTLIFETPMEIFDRKFPGHYVRLIRRVRTSVIALTPANLGIRATLSNSGISRVVIGTDVFQAATIRRPPESAALSSAWSATGLFELDVQPELLVPFEGFGVDTRWQFEMPKPANPLDYDSIADVLFTVEYTALSSYDYRQQVVQNLRRDVSADRAFSFRNDFADAWYQLNNPDVCSAPTMTVSFETKDSDFPANLDPATLSIKHIVVYFVPIEGGNPAVEVHELSFKPSAGASTVSVGTAASNSDGIISTRTGSAIAWTPLLGQHGGMLHPLAGTWTLALTDSPALRTLFSNGNFKDILFVLTYEALTLPWL